MRRALLAVVCCGLLYASHQFTGTPAVSLRPDERRSDFAVPAHDGEAPYTFSLTWREKGTGPVVLLLHGSPGEAADFDRLIPLLARRYRVIAPDLPGFGKSAQVLSDYGIRAQARRMSAFLDAKGIKTAVVLGYSLGSGVAIEMSALQPDRIRRMILYGGIGIQEGEGSGSWLVEHMKYGAGMLFICALPEALPHFGFLGSRLARCGFMRSFLDSDQRPLRGRIERYPNPVLLLQGTDDILVPVETARDHSLLFPKAQLVELPGSHFLVFTDAGSELLAGHIQSFLEMPGTPSSHVPGEKERALHFGVRPAWLSDVWGLARFLAAVVIAGFFAVDSGVILLAFFAAAGFLDIQSTMLAYASGFLFTRIRLFFSTRRTLSVHGERILDSHPDERGRLLIRSIVTAGLWRDLTLGARSRMSAIAGVGVLWGMGSFIAVFLLLPVSFALSALSPPGSNWKFLTLSLSFLPAFLGFRGLCLVLTEEGRRQMRVFFGRARRLEFYPAFLFYLPLLPEIIRLSVRYGGFTTLCASNPGFPDGGFVGESKAEILEQLPGRFTLAHFLVAGGRADDAVRGLAKRGWKYPVIVKPDAGQKGMGVTLCRNQTDLVVAVSSAGWPVLIQKYHPGPFEAGIFYVRHPDQKTGRIFSITDKTLPFVLGDGQRTLGELILAHPRYALQSELFLERYRTRAREIPRAGEKVLLGNAGNHFQGALFRDGAHLITPALNRAVDRIAQSVPGFFFGRFDVRYSSKREFQRGLGFQIVELNGATSESTNVYDPDMPVRRVYSILVEQWRLLFQIGNANIRAGTAQRPPLANLFRAYLRYRRIAPHPFSR